MSYTDPVVPPEIVKNPKTLLDLYANELVEQASSVTHVYGLPSHKLAEYKNLCFDAATKLHSASEILLKEGSTPTTVIIDRTKEVAVGRPSWVWATFLRPALVGSGVLFIVLTAIPGLAERISALRYLILGL